MNIQTMNIQKTKAFTLVELIVVITVLAVLWTIAFISMANYARDSRDSTRMSDIKTTEKALELYSLTNWVYPFPSDYVNVTYSWATVWHQWTVSWSVIQNLWRLSNVPLDPLTETPYAYSINSSKNKYQIAAALEWGEVAFDVIDSSYAVWDTWWKAFVKWTYQWIVTNVLSWSTTYILTLPSLIASDLSSTDVVDIVWNEKLVYNWGDNLPSSYSWTTFNTAGWFSFTPNNFLAYSWSLEELQGTQSKRLTFIQDVQDSYSGTTVRLEANLRSVTQTDLSDTLRADTLAIAIIGWGAIPSSGSGSSNWPSITFTNTSGANYTCNSCD